MKMKQEKEKIKQRLKAYNAEELLRLYTGYTMSASRTASRKR